ncbi:MAG: type II toxin-antitoxin system Phd/YefM family antitoxin [Deltaproteobacteria bacterium]|nr:type II toxin-antitoxin system Phd/YefM family antitoxin [Deltaproteobacteria bacterium]
MKLTVSKLRENIYQILDSVLKTGRPIEIERKGKRLRISAVEPLRKLERLEKRDIMATDPESLVHLDWSSHWKPKLK